MTTEQFLNKDTVINDILSSEDDAHEPVSDWDTFGFDTRQVHAGELPEDTFGARIPPVYLSAGYRVKSFEDARLRFGGDVDSHLYARNQNPTTDVVERKLASLEGATVASTVASGHAAIVAAVLALAGPGDRILVHAQVYSGTRTLFDRTLRRLGITADYMWDDAHSEWEQLFTANTKAVFVESIPNPRNDVLDIAALAALAHRNGVPLIVDNTVATPYLLRPIEYGADIIVHSSTKFLSGHGAGLSGVILDAGRFDWSDQPDRFPILAEAMSKSSSPAFNTIVRHTLINDLGPALSALNGFLLRQGIETLSVRMERHLDNAARIAHWLAQHRAVRSVDYAGLPTHSAYERAQRYVGGRAGSVFSFSLAGGQAAAQRAFDGLRVFSRMTHIGDVRSMVLHPATTTHAAFTPQLRQRLQIDDAMLRLSVGIETVDDLLTDLEGALARV
ncbi:MAG: aminotransferase class I/II-fold pyridoxal phosphate-dependent enzyme [Gordonia sp. (in: high G+C Gram-positive bacteria)]